MIFTNAKKEVIGILSLLILFFTSSCTSSKHSSQKIREAEIIMEEIQQVEAMDYAHTEFKEAQEKLEEARQLAEKRKHKKSALKAEEAEVAAELAEVKTLSQKTDESIKELTASIQSLEDRLAKYREKK